jgi:hypothetical protein
MSFTRFSQFPRFSHPPTHLFYSQHQQTFHSGGGSSSSSAAKQPSGANFAGARNSPVAIVCAGGVGALGKTHALIVNVAATLTKRNNCFTFTTLFIVF